MLAMIAASLVASFLSTTVNWLALIWMGIAAMWVVTARLHQMTAEDLSKLNETMRKSFDTLKKTWSEVVGEKLGLESKYQALDNEYQKLLKQYEDASLEQPFGVPVQSQKPAATRKTTKKKGNKMDDIRKSLAKISSVEQRPEQKEESVQEDPKTVQKKSRWKQGKYSDLNKPADTE